MKNFGLLCRYEFRKIIGRKMVWIAAFFMLAFDAFGTSMQLFGNYYVDGEVYETHYEAFLKDSAYQLALTGRMLDEELISEMQAGYSRLPEGVGRYSTTEEYEAYARPYSAIFHMVGNSTGMNIQQILDWAKSGERMDAALMRDYRRANLEEIWEEDRLTEREKAFWRAREAAEEWPIEFSYVDSWERLLVDSYSTNLLNLFLMAICLTGVFTEEHGRRTDQLVLSSRLGRKHVYLAKICAGLSFALLMTLVISAFVILLRVVLYGGTGFSADYRLIQQTFCGEMTVGQAVLLSYGCIFVTAVFVSLLTMLLAELLRNNIAALAIMTGLLILPTFINIPKEYRIAAQIFNNCMPGELVSEWGLFGNWLVTVFGRCFYSWQVVPAVYLLLSALLVLLGRRLYCGYQVKGR